MDINSAIFDCDGTLLDSMSMWNKVFVDWLTRHHIEGAAELAQRYESLSFDDECFFFHDRYGICTSREAAYEELSEEVIRRYLTEVKPFPGVRSFLGRLRSSHIPLIIVSSTPAQILRNVLTHFGLLSYFKDVLYTGDIGHDKTEPEPYFAARDALGGTTESTWVFEDAPFGVRSAHAAGFPTVCLFNNHDGRNEAFLRANCDIFAHGWEELSLELLRDYERPAKGSGHNPALKVLVVAGSPRLSSPALISRLARQAGYVIATDRGAEALMAADITPDVFCGDADTASEDSAQWARACAKKDIRFPKDKYATDLSIAFDCAEHEAHRRGAPLSLTLTCASGGRPDHFLGVIGQLAIHSKDEVYIVDDADSTPYEGRVLRGGQTWHLGSQAIGKTFSAIALKEGTTISEHGMRWNLEHSQMRAFSDVGISNRVEASGACASCHTGMLACFLIGPLELLG